MIEIKDISVVLGKKIEKNSSIEKKYRFKKNQIFLKTGIKKRFKSDKDIYSEALAIQAVKILKKKNNFDKISHIISVSNTPKYIFPSIANFVSSYLGIKKNVHCIAINSGCTGFVDALLLAYKLIDKVKKNSILITTSDTYSKYLDKKDRSTIPLFSDGGAAILINYSKNGLILKNYYCNTEPNTQADLMGTNEKGFKISMNGPNVLSYALSEVIPQLNSLIGNKKDVVIFCHQAGKIICDQVINNLKNKNTTFPVNYQNCGNLVSTSIPYLLKQKKNLIKKNKYVVFSGFGVGLSQTHALFINKII